MVVECRAGWPVHASAAFRSADRAADRCRRVTAPKPKKRPRNARPLFSCANAYFISLASALPRSAGDFTVVTPAFSSAANFAAAVPLPPEMIAPA